MFKYTFKDKRKLSEIASKSKLTYFKSTKLSSWPQTRRVFITTHRKQRISTFTNKIWFNYNYLAINNWPVRYIRHLIEHNLVNFCVNEVISSGCKSEKTTFYFNSVELEVQVSFSNCLLYIYTFIDIFFSKTFGPVSIKLNIKYPSCLFNLRSTHISSERK